MDFHMTVHLCLAVKDKKDPLLISINPTIEHSLGVQWCMESDTLQFRIDLKDQPLSRRGILSTVSSVFDLLGLVAPFIPVGKEKYITFQTLVRMAMDSVHIYNSSTAMVAFNALSL